ncbi:Glutamate-1-semialdehyde 2,1-aminomutase [Planctomycetales bacterium 10988]|nr:Glutamate-1-semialdehyde 2,1-aminomutase [Planctomycetales bacterium 10988]
MKLSKSEAAYQRACELIPGGVNSPARAFGAVGGTPIFMDRGKGPYLYDLDGNQYLDYIGSWGPLIWGHAHPEILAALEETMKRGTSFGAPTERESVLAELVIDAVPSVERVRFVNSGTEATMSAIRVARGVTKRDLIIKFAGNYHGHVDSLLVAAGSAAATLGVPNSPGVTEGTTKDTLVLEYNDVEGLQSAFDLHGDRIAGVILEPICGNMGVVVPSSPFLQALRGLTTDHGAILIFDEVMTGFRVALGGAQEVFGVTPDMTTLGKIIGGGLPVGAYGGKAEIMDQVMPAGPVFQAGTLSGNPLAVAAGYASLKKLRDEPPYEQLDQMGDRLAKGFHQAAKDAGLKTQIQRVGSMMTLFFNEEPVTGWATASKSDTEKFSKFFWGMMERGVYLPCSQYEALFFSALHKEPEIDQTIDAARETLAEIAKSK